jgi:hypothetical protein
MPSMPHCCTSDLKRRRSSTENINRSDLIYLNATDTSATPIPRWTPFRRHGACSSILVKSSPIFRHCRCDPQWPRWAARCGHGPRPRWRDASAGARAQNGRTVRSRSRPSAWPPCRLAGRRRRRSPAAAGASSKVQAGNLPTVYLFFSSMLATRPRCRSELPHTDPTGRIAGARPRTRWQKPATGCMITVKDYSYGGRKPDLCRTAWWRMQSRSNRPALKIPVY